MRRTPTTGFHDSPEATATLTIRTAGPADQVALRRLAELDSAPPPEPGPMLVADLDGELRAALPLDGGPPIATPFQRTAELVALLEQRVRQFELPTPRPVARRPRSIREPLRASVTTSPGCC